MKPKHIEIVGSFLAIRWDDGGESVVALEDLRRSCPCAHCSGEPDVTGRIRRPSRQPTYDERSFEARGWEMVGQYALQMVWGDGHDTGIYTWSLLRELGRRGED